jgi:hypothetical protein
MIICLRLLSNQDDYKYNILLTPGLFNSLQTGQVTTGITNAQNRGDYIYVCDLDIYGRSVLLL